MLIAIILSKMDSIELEISIFIYFGLLIAAVFVVDIPVT
jgi:hypothetical protein